jgi:hypothetical protein
MRSASAEIVLCTTGNVMARNCIPLLKRLPCAALVLLALGASANSVAGDVPVAALPAKLDGTMMAVEGSVRATNIWFDLDSGGVHSVVDRSVADSLHLPAAGSTSTSGTGKGSVAALALRPFPVRLKGVTFVLRDPLALDLSRAGSAIGARGLLGFELFARYVVEFDYDHRTVSLFEPASYVYRGAGTRVPLVIRPPRAFVWAVVAAPGVAPQRHLLRLDTGSSDAVDDNIVLRSDEPKREITGGVGIGSRFKTYLGYLSSLQIGPFVMHGDLSSATGGVQIIGMGVWHRFNIVFDFSRHCMYLTPRAAPTI